MVPKSPEEDAFDTHIAILLDSVAAEHRDNMGALISALKNIDPSFVYNHYKAFAQSSPSLKADTFYRELRIKGVYDHEPTLRSWWCQVLGMDAPLAELFLDVWERAPDQAKSTIRAYLTSAASFKECSEFISTLASHRTKEEEGKPVEMSKLQPRAAPLRARLRLA